MHPAATSSDNEVVPARHPLGNLQLAVCSDGSFMLGGGAMFGVVPKPL